MKLIVGKMRRAVRLPFNLADESRASLYEKEKAVFPFRLTFPLRLMVRVALYFEFIAPALSGEKLALKESPGFISFRYQRFFI